MTQIMTYILMTALDHMRRIVATIAALVALMVTIGAAL